MLIATLPTLVSHTYADELRAGRIMANSKVDAVRYNTGGASPHSPDRIVSFLADLAKKYHKKVYIDLEGRQVRVAHWSPQSSGVVTLNRDFAIGLPAKAHFRGAGWFKIIGTKPEERKIYLEPKQMRNECFFGESQSVNILAQYLTIKGYLNGLDRDYITAAVKYGMSSFMLSFFESWTDWSEFFQAYSDQHGLKDPFQLDVILKIESKNGVSLVSNTNIVEARNAGLSFMAARDDLFLSYVDHRPQFLSALKTIINKDPGAIVASRIMSGLEHGSEVSLGDIADLALMSRLGYKHFMLSDELSRCIETATEFWETIAKPIIEAEKENRS